MVEPYGKSPWGSVEGLCEPQKITGGVLLGHLPSDYGDGGQNRGVQGLGDDVAEAIDGDSSGILYLWSPEGTSVTQLYADTRREAHMKDGSTLRSVDLSTITSLE